MPLSVEGGGKAVAHGDHRAVGFWMTVGGTIPLQPVRIFVSYEALAQLDPLDIRDFAAAFQQFERFRARIEATASEKFDREGPDPEKYEGMPTVRLTSNDLI
jgi:Protein of unknown function (DUF1488)